MIITLRVYWFVHDQIVSRIKIDKSNVLICYQLLLLDFILNFPFYSDARLVTSASINLFTQTKTKLQTMSKQTIDLHFFGKNPFMKFFSPAPYFFWYWSWISKKTTNFLILPKYFEKLESWTGNLFTLNVQQHLFHLVFSAKFVCPTNKSKLCWTFRRQKRRKNNLL